MTDEADDVELEVISAYIRLTEVREEAEGLPVDSVERLCAGQDLIALETTFNRAVENARARRWVAGEPAPPWVCGYDDGYDMDDDEPEVMEPDASPILDAADGAVAAARTRVADLEVEESDDLDEARIALAQAEEVAASARRSTKSLQRAGNIVGLLGGSDEPMSRSALKVQAGLRTDSIGPALKLALEAGVVVEIPVGGRVRYGLADGARPGH
jgi:hypothetical protein